MRDLLDGMLTHAVIGLDPEGRIRFWNRGAEALLGHAPEEALGQEFALLFRAEDREQGLPQRELRLALEEGLTEDKRWHLRKDGSVFFADGATHLARGGFVKVMADATLRRRMDDDLRRLADLRARLTAELGHEIRNPLAAMVSVVDALRGTPLSPEQRELSHLLDANLERVLTLVNRALDLSRAESGILELEPLQFTLRDAVADVVAPAGLRAQSRGLGFACVIEPEVPGQAIGDSARLKQVLDNLVGNAVKFTESGRVVVRVGSEETRERCLMLGVSVEDTGPGIPPDRQAAVFEPFVQADPAIASRHGGSGLGLGIARRLVEAMGGRLHLESTPGRGTRVRFTVRLDYAPAEERLREVLRELGGLEVVSLLSEDLRRQELDGFLRHWGVAHHPEELHRLVEPGRRILLAETSRLEEGLLSTARGAGAPVVALARSHLERPPGDAVVYAPLTQSGLVNAFRHALRQPPAPAPREVRRVSATRRLILAEDEPVTRQALSLSLRKEGFEVVTASDGLEALHRWQLGDVDLLITDLQLPRLDGLLVTRRIRRNENLEQLRRTPVLVVTGSDDEATRLECLEAGADEVLVKPVRAEELLRILSRLLGE